MVSNLEGKGKRNESHKKRMERVRTYGSDAYVDICSFMSCNHLFWWIHYLYNVQNFYISCFGGQNMKLTGKEKIVLENIARNDYTTGNGAEPETVRDTYCWADCVDCGPNNISRKSLPGIIGSLVKKGLVLTDGECIELSEEGFNAYKSLKSLKKDFS